MAWKSNLVRMAGPLGLYAMARQLCRRHPRILMYHRFSQESCTGFTSRECFRRQVRHIKRHYQPITLGQLLEVIDKGEAVPRNAVIITIDDGYRDVYEVAYPILKEEDVPATLFVATGFIEGRLWLWPDQVRWLLDQTEAIHEPVLLDHVTLEKGALTNAVRDRYWERLIHYLLRIPDERKHELIEQLANVLGHSLPVEAPEPYRAASWQELREIQESGIEIGGHTVTHPSLGQVDDKQAEREITGCRDAIEQNLGRRPDSFCYPNGQETDFTEAIKAIVENAGFKGAVTAFPDAVGIAEHYAMRRHTGGDDWFQFMKSVSGLEWLGHWVRERSA